MKQPLPNSEPLNVRPSRLETDQDLLQDQLDYFRASNQLPDPPQSFQTRSQQDDHHLALLARPQGTPTSSLLQPVKEHPVVRNSRRRPRSKTSAATATPFPQSSLITHHNPSRFARTFQQQRSAPASNEHPSQSSISQQVRRQVGAMSIEQIHEAQQEIYYTLKPESIEILKRMWLRKDQGLELPERRNLTTARDRTSKAPHDPPLDTDLSKLQHPLSFDAHTELLIPVKPEESDDEEREKRLWMTDAEDATKRQPHVDQLMERALKMLGDAGQLRFGLTGDVLTSEDIQTLPTHLGLHHHGSQPASAGYTLPDVLVLMRSTVVGQRVMAMRMLKSIVSQHRDKVIAPLIASGTLSTAFSNLRLNDSFYSAITNQIAYLELIECFIGDAILTGGEYINSIYFASNFYSPCHVKQVEGALPALANSDIVTNLVGIARASATRLEHFDVTERSLRLLLAFAANNSSAAHRILQNRACLLALKNLTAMNLKTHPLCFALSCQVLSQVIVSSAWDGGAALEQLQTEVMDERFLRTLTSRMVWLFDSDIREVTANQSLEARAVLRLIRAALAFERGIDTFAALSRALCRLVRHEDTAVEAYLAMEAYCHALYVEAGSCREARRSEAAGESVRRSKQLCGSKGTSIADLLSELIPNAVLAATVFVEGNGHSKEVRAAAGHFAATLFALTSHPIVEDLVSKGLKECSYNMEEISHLPEDSADSIQRLQVLASLSHATARLFSMVKLGEGYLKKNIRILMASAKMEQTMLERFTGTPRNRVSANSAVEWLGLYSKVGSSKTTIELALILLPSIDDGRVIVDLLSRSFLNVDILLGLSPTFSRKAAEKCTTELLTWTMTELLTTQLSSRGSERSFAPASFRDFCKMWVIEDELYESVFSIVAVFFRCGLLTDTALFDCLLRTPMTRYADSVFELMFKAGRSCIFRGGSLIATRDETKVSALSTTVNSTITNSVLSLCDFLQSRGPASHVVASNENPDFLSSILLTLMCGFDIDNTLRVSMWKKTVDDCGSAALYEGAVSLELDRTSRGPGSRSRLDNMLRLFGISISEGYLDRERCPKGLRDTIVARIMASLSSGRSADETIEELASSVRNRSSLARWFESLEAATRTTSIETNELWSELLSQFSLLS